MRNFYTIILVMFTVLSCSDVKFNSPAMQANKNGELWRAQFYASDIDFGGFVIEGGNNLEVVQLFTTNDVRGTFELGGDSQNVAIYRDANGVVYSTANAPDPSLSIYPTDGQIVVEDIIDNVEPKTLIGTFWFNAYTADGLSYINFNEGVFYKVPLIGGLELIQN